MKKTFILLMCILLSSTATFALTTLLGPATICQGSSDYIVEDSLYPGGIWSSSNTAIATIDSDYISYWGNITGVSAGTVTLTYTLGTSYITKTITILAVLPTPITGTTSLCPGATTSLSNATPGGTWSSDYTYIATIGSTSGLVTGVTIGTTQIEYNLSGYCPASTMVSIIGVPIDSVYGPSVVCLGSTGIFSDVTSGGTWSSSNSSVASVASSGIVTGVALGTAIISYTIAGTCGTYTGTVAVTVSNTTTPPSIIGPSSVMMSSGILLYSTVYGGTWSSSNTAVATISSGYITPVSIGTTTITYTIIGCGGSASSTSLVTVTPYDEISGNVLFTGTPGYGPVTIYLITYDPSTANLQALDSTSVYCNGCGSVAYKFNAEPTDSFRVKAVVDSAAIGTTGYTHTYGNSSYYWHSADVFLHSSGTADINKNITMMTGTITSGPGFIGGNVLTGANKGTSGGVAVGLRMYLLNSSGSVLQQTTTDATGAYTFTNLSPGTYTVFPEALNYITNAYTGITLTATTTSMTAASFTQHTLSHTITPILEGVNNVTPVTSSMFAFPNPSTGKLNLQWNIATTEKATVTVTDIAGRELYTTTMDMKQGLGTSSLDLSGLNNGLYTVTVKSISINYSNQIQILNNKK